MDLLELIYNPLYDAVRITDTGDESFYRVK